MSQAQSALGGALGGAVGSVSLPTVTITGQADIGFKVRVKGPGGILTFEASSPLTEARNANYGGFDITHLPTALQAYRNTGARKWTITGKLVSRTAAEASRNARFIDLARSWILPDFGGTGATPPILKLFAYKNINIAGRQCILTSYDWNFPDDVDYIHTGEQPMPVIGTLTLNLEEVYSAEQITNGDWKMQGVDGFSDSVASPLAAGVGSLTKPGGLMQQLGAMTPNLTNLASGASSVLGTAAGAPNLLGAIAGSAVKTLGGSVLSDPRVTSVLSSVPAPLQSILTSGANGVITDLTRGVTNAVTTVTRAVAPTDPFRTTNPLTPPTLVGADPNQDN